MSAHPFQEAFGVLSSVQALLSVEIITNQNIKIFIENSRPMDIPHELSARFVLRRRLVFDNH